MLDGKIIEARLGKALAVSKFEITFAQWDICIAAGGCPTASDSGWGRGERPVINVGWDDAQQYIAWLSRITGHEYRLLGEAEWQYVAEGKHWKDSIIQEGIANCDGCNTHWAEKTVPVGSFKPNMFGLYDIYGNVWEWVEDRFLNSGDTAERVVRGGSWQSHRLGLGAEVRYGYATSYRSNTIGFRLARTLNP
jgi:formylglycine-generating enzyme required for sulfatase activity